MPKGRAKESAMQGIPTESYSRSSSAFSLGSSLADCDWWVCTKCGEQYAFPRKKNLRGGPRRRAIDRRFGWYYCRRKCKKDRVVRHESIRQTEQPLQDEGNIQEFLDALRGRTEEPSGTTR